jgi:hypothetical protein
MTTLSQLACHGCLKATFLLHGFPVMAFLSWLSCHGFLVMAVLSRLSCHSCTFTTCLQAVWSLHPVMAVLSCFHVMAALPYSGHKKYGALASKQRLLTELYFRPQMS